MKTLQINPRDNVAVMLEGELRGHKTALCDIKKGENIIKYGYSIGRAAEDIKKGSHVHVHNIKTNLSGAMEYTYDRVHYELPRQPKRTFMGYVREDGRVGIRNEIWIVNTVGCVNKTAELIAREANKLYGGECDGVFCFPHPFGCSQLGDDQRTTQSVLKGLTEHPNAAGVLVLGLGCENNNIPVFKEMFGAETILMNRCVNEDVFKKTVSLINDFKDYFERHGQVVYENPSPGNKKGGITTLEDKSLGCVQKAGSADVADVIGIGERVRHNGLNLLTGPGNDIVAVTNLTASGCSMILFSTGRGTPVGAPVPTVKISTNNDLAQRKPHWIDFNAGPEIDGEDLSEALMEYIISVANGERTNNEKNGYREISIFKDGVVL